MKKEYRIPLLSNVAVGSATHVLTFRSKEIAATANPGQFVNVSSDLFLKRPFGVLDTDPEAGTFSIGVRRIGAGTGYICDAVPGTFFEVLGPLGNGFVFDQTKRIIAIGGGTGIFPLRFALKRARELGIPSLSLNGFRSKSDIILLSSFEEVADQVRISTDAGDFGTKGNVVDLLSELTKEEMKDAILMTVGPEIMMKNVAKWADGAGLFCQVSLEKRMACGIGACLVCVCKVKAEAEGEPFRHVRCCKEGPVFAASEVIW